MPSSLLRSSFLKANPALAAVVLLGLAGVASNVAHAQTTVDYASMGNFTQNGPFTSGGITITGSGTLRFAFPNGLSVVGGPDSVSGGTIDSGETILFTFDNGPATNVTTRLSTIGRNGNFPLESTVEAFGVGGASLGVYTYQGGMAYPNYNLSTLISSSPISALRITGGANSFVGLRSITYTPSALTAVPEPGEWASMGIALTGLSGLMICARRKKASS